MTRKPKRPRKFRGRAPWRWHWGRIVLMVLGWWAWSLALGWSAFFGLVLSAYLYAQLRAACNEPRSPTGDEKGLEDEEAGPGFVFTEDPDQPNHWKVTKSE